MEAMIPATGMKMGPIECRPALNSAPSPESSLRIAATAPITTKNIMIAMTTSPMISMPRSSVSGPVGQV
jgi:hypothetical protein